jgi:cytochrome c oxidase cbb3-type subunit III
MHNGGRTIGPICAVMLLLGCGRMPTHGDAGAPPPAVKAIGPVIGVPSREAQQSNPYANDRAATGQGRQLFVRFNCSGCHGGRAGGGMGPSLRDVDWLYGNGDAQIFNSIADGRAHGMPAWQLQLTNDQIWKLVSYIKSLRTRNEPQAPQTD